MKKEKIEKVWYCTINIDFLCTAIFVIVDDGASVLKDAALKIDKELDTANLMQEGVRKLLEGDYLYSSTLTAPNAAKDIIVFFNAPTPDKVPYETMVHEFHHAAHNLCECRGIDGEETEAYLQEYLFHEMLCKADNYKAAQKKVRRKPKKSA